MTALTCRLRNIILSVIALSALALPAWGETQAGIKSTDLDHQSPFGFSWRSFDEPGAQIGKDPLDVCRELIAPLDAVIAPDKREDFAKKCASEKYKTVFVSNDRVSIWLRQGELSVVLRGESEPVSYDYSYLHRVLPDDDRENTIRRKNHASAIREELNDIYGSPVAAGFFDQNTETGFVVDDVKNQPCEFWVKEDVGILLCAERVVLVDGIEMALSFIRLDRASYGHQLRCMVDPASLDDCEDARERATDKPAGEVAGSIKILADWLGSDSYSKCSADDLEPIEKIWALPETEKAKLAAVLEAYTGEDLALYAIDYANNMGSESSAEAQNKIIMYLFKRAALQGSATAMNEIGASLLYCLQNVRQDTAAALYWLEKAARAGDARAMRSLAAMHLSGMTEAKDQAGEGERLLEECSRLDKAICSKELTALKTIIAAQDQ